MEVKNVLHMNGGEGATGYTNISIYQRQVMLKVKPILEDAIKSVVNTTFPTYLKVADLGCSSGPNTLFVNSNIINTIHGTYQQMNYKLLELQVFLNDLPRNDFNTVFKSLSAFYQKLKEENRDIGPSFVVGIPGSLYGRLFPSKSLHLVHSSCSLHWLSQVPDGLSNNKGNVFIAKSSPPSVFKAYTEQFRRDFSKFLSSRGEEIMSGGRMLLTFLGRSDWDPTTNDCCKITDLISKSLLDLVAEGLVEEADVDAFNAPLYKPCKGEVRAIIQNDGSFNIDKLETYGVDWDPSDHDDNQGVVFDKNLSGQNVAKWVRAASEGMLASHFGEKAMDRLFMRFAEHVAEHLCREKTKDIVVVVSMTKK